MIGYTQADSGILPKTFGKLNAFENLVEGWHYGQGGPIAGDTIRGARSALSALILQGFKSTDVAPSEYGEVLVTGFAGRHYIAITVQPDGLSTFNHEVDDVEQSFLEGVTLNEVRRLIGEVAAQVCPTFVLYIHANSTELPANSMTWRSHGLVTAGCRSSIVNAQPLALA